MRDTRQKLEAMEELKSSMQINTGSVIHTGGTVTMLFNDLSIFCMI
jgi:hypothetical protein